jgi:hypothetical protein
MSIAYIIAILNYGNGRRATVLAMIRQFVWRGFCFSSPFFLLFVFAAIPFGIHRFRHLLSIYLTYW